MKRSRWSTRLGTFTLCSAHRGNVSIIKVSLECDPQTAYFKDKNGQIPLQVGAYVNECVYVNLSTHTSRNPFATQKSKSITSQVDNAKEATLAVAALIATVTFAAGFTLPGGYVSNKGMDQGTAVVKKNTAFEAFVITDTIALVLSTAAVFTCYMTHRTNSELSSTIMELDCGSH
ncbi:hypothetical protein FNV43_RR02538 [Rhamnella rubrinervis]|uniref:PGG domain-containing protein n=1 Tax=Rhamnella rubrinervis TaxID=2594499 RepID=A0A8K0HT57_9ROSA|nr:hypothetical protein FNV43_RR02538 [Rhamnella rubrinervis]